MAAATFVRGRGDGGEESEEGEENDRELDYKDGWLMEDDVVEYAPEQDGADPSIQKVNGLALARTGGASHVVIVRPPSPVPLDAKTNGARCMGLILLVCSAWVTREARLC